jgi:hypothetical protein
MSKEYSDFKVTHPAHQLIENKIMEHANDARTKQAIADRTYFRSKPRKFTAHTLKTSNPFMDKIKGGRRLKTP